MPADKHDHYQALGVASRADAAQIRAAYVRLMWATHPDRRPGDAPAVATAQRANAAYTVLGDARRRATYDRLRANRAAAAVGTSAAPRVVGRHDAGADHHPGGGTERGRRFRRAFHLACLKVGAAVCALGVVLLLAALG